MDGGSDGDRDTPGISAPSSSAEGQAVLCIGPEWGDSGRLELGGAQDDGTNGA